MKDNVFITFAMMLFISIMASCSDDNKALGTPCAVLNEGELSFTGYATSKVVEFTCNRAWAAKTQDDWVSVTPNSYPGAGENFMAYIRVSATDNDEGESRQSKIDFLVDGDVVATLTVLQDKKNEEDKPVLVSSITWANLQWQVGDAIAVGTQFEAACCAFKDGVSNVLEDENADGWIYEIGYSKENTNPASEEGWTWSNEGWSSDWGDNFFFQLKTPIINDPGIYYYTFRLRTADEQVWAYAGTNGLWDGVDNVNGTFTVVGEAEDDTDYDALAITWANLQWNATTEIDKGAKFEGGTCIFIEGLTNAEQAAVAGNEHITCEIGFGETSDPQDDGWQWQACWWNGDWGDNWYYQGTTSEIMNPGIYYYTYRIRINEKEWAYAGSNGLWDGESNVCGQFTVKD